MPGPIPTGTSAAFQLLVQGVDITRRVPAESVRITEVSGGSNATLEFEYEQFFSTTPDSTHFAWLTGLSQHVVLTDLTNARKLFVGTVVNARRRHTGNRNLHVSMSCVSYDAWLDRLWLPAWLSKRPNLANIASDRLQIQSITTGIANSPPTFTAWDAINTYVDETNTNMPQVQFPNGGSARTLMQGVADAAATAADPAARHFYVDFDGHLHYYKGLEGNAAPFRLGDADYPRVVKATTGLVSYWPFAEGSGASVSDAQSYAHGTLAGGYTRGVSSLVANVLGTTATTLNGTTGYMSASGANLHQVDGPWSIELWFKRTALGGAMALWSSGTNDALILLDATDHIVVQKEGTGNNFVSDNTYTSLTAPVHLVVSRPAGGATVVYVNGASITGTTTARTFASAAGAINIGRKLSTTDSFFDGTIAHVAYYSAALSAATALAHYNDAWTIVPDDFEFETDVNDAGAHVYVRGGNATGTGWVFPTPANAAYQQSFVIDRPQSTTAALKVAYGTAFLKGEANEIYGGRATITMPASTWRAGQTVTIDDANLGIDGTVCGISQTYEIKQLNTSPNMGSGVCTYEIYFGALPPSATFSVQRKKKNK